MLIPLLLGSLMIVGNMAIQIVAMLALVRFLLRRFGSHLDARLWSDTLAIGAVVMLLFVGHVLQFATWATLFVYLGEFEDFTTAFYHSTVNFTSLGYGDIVMSPRWRLLGGLEAANGVLMFGLSAGAILSTMSRIFARHAPTERPGRGDANP